jgi:hypothetical protein
MAFWVVPAFIALGRQLGCVLEDLSPLGLEKGEHLYMFPVSQFAYPAPRRR